MAGARLGFRICRLSLCAMICSASLSAQSFLAQLKTERNPGKRAHMALEFADDEFEQARDFYSKGRINQGDAALDDMTHALKECLNSLQEEHKSGAYKKPELRVADLERRLKGLVGDLNVQDRGWAEQMQREVDQIHDNLLAGVMGK